MKGLEGRGGGWMGSCTSGPLKVFKVTVLQSARCSAWTVLQEMCCFVIFDALACKSDDSMGLCQEHFDFNPLF